MFRSVEKFHPNQPGFPLNLALQKSMKNKILPIIRTMAAWCRGTALVNSFFFLVHHTLLQVLNHTTSLAPGVCETAGDSLIW